YIGKCIELNKVLENDEDLAKVYFVNGKIQLKSRKYEAATESFLKASELFFDKNDFVSGVEAQEKLASTYLAQDKTDQAIETLNSVIQKSEKFQLNSVLFNTHYMLYQIYKETNVTKALEELERYVELKGEHDKKFINSVVNSYSVLSRIEDSEKEAEKEQELASIIEKKNSEMDSFFYRVSHDLKGPIASLLGLSDLAKRDVSDTKALHYLKMYENQIKRLNMIVMELINITELNYREIKRTDINFYEIIDNCITAYTYLPNFDSIVFKIEVQSNLTFSSEWYIVNTILQNLIENSIKYLDKNKEESTVHITVYGTKTDINIEVKDNGQGIDKEHQGKIFDMFYRANNSAQGTGLGLFILKRAVERLHGEIKLESTPGIGTTFNISLPKNI
ncbi:two-component sensor histidine kinase, partial [Marivirga lumbricoides]